MLSKAYSLDVVSRNVQEKIDFRKVPVSEKVALVKHLSGKATLWGKPLSRESHSVKVSGFKYQVTHIKLHNK